MIFSALSLLSMMSLLSHLYNSNRVSFPLTTSFLPLWTVSTKINMRRLQGKAKAMTITTKQTLYNTKPNKILLPPFNVTEKVFEKQKIHKVSDENSINTH